MASIIENLHKQGLIKPPHFLIGGTQYETIMGSEAYGVATDLSDKDIYGFCMPTREMVFPHTAGQIQGFGRQIQRFEQYQQHHVKSSNGNTYDLNIYSIIKYFQLCMENNPNMIDSLFTPRRCVLHETKIAKHVRDNRKIFLHKGCWHKFKGYAYSQMNKMRVKNPDPESKRYESIMKHGYDVKFAYHIVRLINEVEQILIEQDLSLDRNNDQLKSIRSGDWKMHEIEEWFYDKEKSLEKLYVDSTLPHKPNESAIKRLLLECLEEHYGSLKDCVEDEDKYKIAFQQVYEIVQRTV